MFHPLPSVCELLLLLLLLSHFGRVWLCATPSLGFSRQEHWSGLPFPSPMYESEKWKWSCSVMSDSSQSHGLQPTRLLCPWASSGKSTGVGCHCLLPGDLLDPGIKPGSPALQAVSLPSKPSRKPQSVFSYINEMSFGTSKDEGWWPGESIRVDTFTAPLMPPPSNLCEGDRA